MLTLDFIRASEGLDLAAFTAQLGGPALLAPYLPPDAPPDGSMAMTEHGSSPMPMASSHSPEPLTPILAPGQHGALAPDQEAHLDWPPPSAGGSRILVDQATGVSIDLGGLVLPLVRSSSNPFSDKLAVGRTRNCDVRIEHASISRLHALLLRGADGTWNVTDAGSSNGTRLNGQPVSKGTTLLLQHADVVVFGSVATQFVIPEKLYDALRNLRPL
jgi:hypothetical protein